MNYWPKETTGQMVVENVIVIGLFLLILIGSIPSLRKYFIENLYYSNNKQSRLDPTTVHSQEELTLSDKAVIKGKIKLYSNQERQAFRFPLPMFPRFPYGSIPAKESLMITRSIGSQNITEDGFYPKISLDGSLVIDTGKKGHLRKVIIDELEMRTDSHLVVEGSGTLILFIRNNLSLIGSATINKGGKPEYLKMYYLGQTLSLKEGAQEVIGGIYVEKTKVILSGNCSLKGTLVVGEGNVQMEGNATLDHMLLYAPLSRVRLSDNASLKGKIIAKNISCSGSSLIEYKPLSMEQNFFIK